MTVAKDTGYAPSTWQFDSEVTRVFDDMFARSIPDYEALRKITFDVGTRFVQPSTDIVDLGCARGGALAQFVDRFGFHNRFIGIEISEPMAEGARQRFGSLIDAKIVDIRRNDLRIYYPPVKASLTLAIMTIQFTPLEYRQRIIQRIYDSTLPGGAFVFAEKILGRDDRVNSLLVDVYYQVKAEHGYSQDEIERKRLALEGVLVPVTAAWNEDLLRVAGFAHVDCIWRYANFAAWLAIKAA